MSIIFTNPYGNPVKVADRDVTYDGDFAMAEDPETGEMMVMSLEDTGMDLEATPPGQLADEGMNRREEVDDMEDLFPDPINSNPSKQLFNWKNLRLQSAIDGEKAVKGALVRAAQSGLGIATAGSALKRALTRQISANTSIRSSPTLLKMVDANDWFTYISRMSENPVDMGAELSVTVSGSQKIAVAHFCREWEMDPGHSSVMNKAEPGADPQQVLAIGNMIYDLMTGRGPNISRARGYGSLVYDKMYRLCYDMLMSLPIKIYNSYTLYQLEADEGGQVFSEVTRNYVPLEMAEVGLILELRERLAMYGPGYANMAISDPQVAAEAAALMQKAVSAYNSGDTVNVRSILNYLQQPPFYYRSVAEDAKSIFSTGDASDVVGVNLNPKDPTMKALAYNGLYFLKGFKSDWIKKETGQISADDKVKEKSFEMVRSPFDNTVVGVVKFGNSKNNITFTPGATLSKRSSGAGKKTSDIAQILEDGNSLDNPRAKGRGKNFNLQLHPKTQLKMKMQSTSSTGQGDIRHGRPPKGKEGSQNTWSKGLYNLLKEDIERKNAIHRKDKKTRRDKFPQITVMVQGGIHKKTGKWAPYLIKLPKSHFQTKRLPTGEMTIGLRTKDASPQIKKAWTEFQKEYGIFEKKSTKAEHYRFIPSKKAEHRGAYQERVRRQIGAAKRSR